MRPHPLLARFYDDEEERVRRLRSWFDRSAGRYDRIPRATSFGSGHWVRRYVVARAGPARGASVLDRTFREARRVLRAAGKLVVLEITPPGSAIPRGLLALDLGRVVPWLARRYGRSARELMEYHGATIAQCVPPATIVEALRSRGFARVRRRVEVGIFSEYSAVAA